MSVNWGDRFLNARNKRLLGPTKRFSKFNFSRFESLLPCHSTKAFWPLLLSKMLRLSGGYFNEVDIVEYCRTGLGLSCVIMEGWLCREYNMIRACWAKCNTPPSTQDINPKTANARYYADSIPSHSLKALCDGRQKLWNKRLFMWRLTRMHVAW